MAERAWHALQLQACPSSVAPVATPDALPQLKQLRQAATEEQEQLEARAASLAAELAAARQEAAAAQAAVAEREAAVQEEARAALTLASELVAAQQQLTAAEARIQELEAAQRSVDTEVGARHVRLLQTKWNTCPLRTFLTPRLRRGCSAARCLPKTTAQGWPAVLPATLLLAHGQPPGEGAPAPGAPSAGWLASPLNLHIFRDLLVAQLLSSHSSPARLPLYISNPLPTSASSIGACLPPLPACPPAAGGGPPPVP